MGHGPSDNGICLFILMYINYTNVLYGLSIIDSKDQVKIGRRARAPTRAPP